MKKKLTKMGNQDSCPELLALIQKQNDLLYQDGKISPDLSRVQSKIPENNLSSKYLFSLPTCNEILAHIHPVVNKCFENKNILRGHF